MFGTIGGLGLGLFLGWGFVRATASDGVLDVFSAPLATLAIVLLTGAVAGVLASVRPARRAARLDVLRAISAE